MGNSGTAILPAVEGVIGRADRTALWEYHDDNLMLSDHRQHPSCGIEEQLVDREVEMS